MSEVIEVSLSEIWNHNPFISKVWRKVETPIRRDFVRECLKENEISPYKHNPRKNYSCAYHAKRIAYFVKERYSGQDGGIKAKIVDGQLVITDGYHRLGALFYRKAIFEDIQKVMITLEEI